MSTRPARPPVYVSHPITLGDPRQNVKRAIEVGRWLIDLGFAPLVPGLDWYYPRRDSLDWGDWMAVDLPWVRRSKAILRIPGKSSGADWECRVARRHSVPVFGSEETELEDAVRALCEAFGFQFRTEAECKKTSREVVRLGE